MDSEKLICETTQVISRVTIIGAALVAGFKTLKKIIVELIKVVKKQMRNFKIWLRVRTSKLQKSRQN